MGADQKDSSDVIGAFTSQIGKLDNRRSVTISFDQSIPIGLQ
jgi:hypothetical protein